MNKRSDNSRQWVNPWYNGKNTDADADKKSEADTLPEDKQQKLMEYSRYRSQVYKVFITSYYVAA